MKVTLAERCSFPLASVTVGTGTTLPGVRYCVVFISGGSAASHLPCPQPVGTDDDSARSPAARSVTASV